MLGTALGNMADGYQAYKDNNKTMDTNGTNYGTNYETNSSKERSTIDYEGFSSSIYEDTKGYKTIGFGHKLTKEEIESGIYDNGISEEEARKLFEQEYHEHIEQFYSNFEWVKEQPEHVRKALEDMAYNMGPSWMHKWPKLQQALKTGDYERAAHEIATSKYRQEVGSRAKDNMDRIRGLR